MAHDEVFDVLPESELRALLHGMSEEELSLVVEGVDVGVARQVTLSSGKTYQYSPAVDDALLELDDQRGRFQRVLSRMNRANDRDYLRKQAAADGSSATVSAAKTIKRPRTHGEKRQAAKIARLSRKIANISDNHAHHISKQIAEESPLLSVWEDLNLRNMTRAPKARRDPETGKWLPNGASAKAGLNRALLKMRLGKVRSYTAYKLAERGKLLINVPAAYSSQECSQCGHTAEDNRKTQADFECLKCGYTANADDNASATIKKRGIRKVLDEAFTEVKTARKVSVRRKSEESPALEPASLGDSGSREEPAVISEEHISRPRPHAPVTTRIDCQRI